MTAFGCVPRASVCPCARCVEAKTSPSSIAWQTPTATASWPIATCRKPGSSPARKRSSTFSSKRLIRSISRRNSRSRSSDRPRFVSTFATATESSQAYPLAVSTLVGREPELSEVAGFLEADEAEAALAIVGEPGIGKTAVWNEAVQLARESGALVLSARPAESEATLSFAGLTDLLAELDADRFESLPPPQRHALEVAVLRAASDRAAERRLVGTALLSLLREVADAGLVVVAVDDAHWLDAPSAAALAFATRRLDSPGVQVLVSLRSEAEHDWLAKAGLERRVRRLELGPL